LWYEIDNLEYRRLRESRNELLALSLENYLRSLEADDLHDTDVLRFFALWLENVESPNSVEVVEQHLTKVPSWKFVVLMNQLSSRIQQEDNPFQKFLQSLVLRICMQHPYHGMYHIYAGARTPGGKDEGGISRNKAAKSIADRLTKSTAGGTWRRIHSASHYFAKLANAPSKELASKYGKKMSLRHFPEAVKAAETAASQGVPPPTMAVTLRPNGDYSDVPKFSRFEPTIQIASGLSEPKILTVIATDGKPYKQLVGFLVVLTEYQLTCILV
jgi:serine-protein kinase ATM